MFLSSPYTITTYSIGFLMPLVFMKEMGNNKKYVSLSVLPYLAGIFMDTFSVDVYM